VHLYVCNCDFTEAPENTTRNGSLAVVNGGQDESEGSNTSQLQKIELASTGDDNWVIVNSSMMPKPLSGSMCVVSVEQLYSFMVILKVHMCPLAFSDCFFFQFIDADSTRI